MDLGLGDRVCVITGGSGGIGRATARRLAAEGASVLLVGRDEDRLADAARQCDRAQWLAIDVTDPDIGQRVVDECRERFGRLDVLVNSAGMSSFKPLPELDDDDYQAHWELHVMAPLRLMRAAVPVMVDRGWGRVVNVSSTSGKRPSQTNVAYSVSKAAVLSLSRAYADRYARDGVLVNAVTPGPIGDDLWLAPGGLADQTAQATSVSREEVLEGAAGGLPIRRLAESDEVAAVIVFLCSQSASNVVGAAWSVDGGAVPVIL
ncbi:MAG TPA: SDR family oxidoreductase [Solirubrobacteraceae bacterium]|jgi:3-oxoacyl-[acyl-carrier protein] reductase